jgi:DNA-binding NtrC family response regulator
MMAAILIVDDSATQNACLQLLLSNLGHRPECVGSINEARIFCERNHVDLCLIELLLFKNNGFEIAPELQKITAAPTVLMLSRRLEADVIWAAAQQIRNFLYRPCTPEICANLVASLLLSNKLPRPSVAGITGIPQ